MKQRLSRKKILIIVVLIFPIISLGKFAMYELSGLRTAVGDFVALPKPENQIGREMMKKPLGGELMAAEYRWNDKVGFFDLKVDIEYPDGNLSRGLGPFEAFKVRKIDRAETEPRPSGVVNDEAAPHRD